MDKKTFKYIWDQAIVRAVNNVISEVPEKIRLEFDVKPAVSQEKCDKLFKEYEALRQRPRERFFDVGQNGEKLMDSHKICACITGAILRVQLVSFNLKVETIPVELAFVNYCVAFLAGIHTLYLTTLSDYIRFEKNDCYEELYNQATFMFPETNQGHDAYILGRVKTLAMNDVYGNDFDVLTYADMLFWIEKYNKDIIQKKVEEKSR